MTSRPTFEVSIDTRLVYDALIAAKPGETVTFVELGKILGAPVAGDNGHVQSALRRALRNDDAVFDNVRGVGYRRLNDEEIVKLSERDTTLMRRRSRRAAERLTKVQDFGSLPPQRKIEHNARLSIFSAIAAMTKTASLKSVENMVSSSGRELPFLETLAAFRKESAA